MSSEIEEKRSSFEKDFNKEDPHTSWVKQPHTISLLLLVIGAATAYAFLYAPTASFESNIKHGIGAVSIFFLVFSSLQMKDGLFYRPHPMVWRTIMGLGVLYLSLLVFILFQSADDARYLLSRYDPTLGKPLPERSYADHCELYTPNESHPFRHLWDTVNDEFILAHLLGWFGKALLFRDVYLCWIMSILFEILEVTFEHMLPNFKECWWDHVILDILVCNWLGFTIGLWVVKYFSMKQYYFLTPSFEQYHWEVLQDWKRLVYVLALIITVSITELNAFFLKYVLYIPPPNPLNIIRLLIVWGMGLPAVRELYFFVTDKRCKKFGSMAWLSVAVMIVELLICVKFGKGMFPVPPPMSVVYGWGAFLGLFALWAVWFYGFHIRGKGKVSSVGSTTANPGYLSKSTPKVEEAKKSSKKNVKNEKKTA